MRAAGEGRGADCNRVWRVWPHRKFAIRASLLSLLLFVLLPAVAGATERVMSFGPDGTETSDFARVGGVSVDQEEGSVYVLDETAGQLLKFGLGGQPVDFGGTSTYIDGNRIKGLDPFSAEDGGEGNESQVAVDSASHTIYVTDEHAVRAFQANGEPSEFTAGPGNETSEIPGFSRLVGVAVDASGNVYASDHAGTVSIFAPSGAPITSFSVLEPRNLAVTESGVVYALKGRGEDTFSVVVEQYVPDSLPIGDTTAYTPSTFAEPQAPFGYLRTVAVDPNTLDVYALEAGPPAIHRYSASGDLIESFGDLTLDGGSQGLSVLGESKEVSPGRTIKLYAGTQSRVAAFGSNIVIGRPSIDNTSALEVTADSATLRAWVNPNTAETDYRFEFGLEDCAVSSCKSVPLGGASIGDGHEPIEVTQPIAGLAAGTNYHYRIVAKNAFGETNGPGHEFITQTLGLGFDLIDSRAWEMVSPSNKEGAELWGARLFALQAASDGNGLVYQALGAIEADPDGNRALELSSVLARRSLSGWRSEDISPPNERVVPFGAGQGGEYKLFNPDLSRAILDPSDGTLLSPQASERAPYLWQNGDPPSFTPLLTGKDGFANVPAGTEFGGGTNTRGPVSPIGSTRDLSHVVLRSSGVALTAAPAESGALYIWTEGRLQAVTVLPAEKDGEVRRGELGSGPGTVHHAISEDGSRIFWGRGDYSGGGNNLTALYLHDTEAEETVRLDLVQTGGDGGGLAKPVFQGASADGTVVFFTDSQRLTPQASLSGQDLYRCEIPPGSPASGCASLTDLTAPSSGSSASAEVLGLSPGLSEDGSRIYFVARGELDAAPNQGGEGPVGGEPNLYLWQEGQALRFIATLSEEDRSSWGAAAPDRPGLSYGLSAIASPNGRFLSFMSQGSLTGYSNLDEASGTPVQEVFRFDAFDGSLSCLSCNPSGAAPEGESSSDPRPIVDSGSLWINRKVAAVLPQPTRGVWENTLHHPRAVFDNGRVFFNALDSLVAADSNGEWDVYQSEPLGVGGCSNSSGDAATAVTAGGCVSLISSGTAEAEAGFLDAGETGADVFFLTSARLSVTDEDNELDAYDARVNGVPAVLSPRSECQGESCQPATLAPSDPTPGTATFFGPSDPKVDRPRRCPKAKRRVRRHGQVRCLPRRHGTHKHPNQRAGLDRRAAR